MKTVLIVLAAIVGLWMLAGAGVAAWQAFSKSGKRQERARATLLLAQVPKGAFGILLLVFSAFRLQDSEKANGIVASHPTEAALLLKVLRQPRDANLSAGAFGDRLGIEAWLAELRRQNYSPDAADVVALVFHHHLEPLLDEIIEKQPWKTKAGHPGDGH